MPMARGALLFSAYPYYVEREGKHILLTVQNDRIGTDIIMEVPTQQVGEDLARLLQLSRIRKLPVEFMEP